MIGSPLHIALAVVEGIGATILIAMAVEGYFRRPMDLLERIALMIAGLCLFAPGWKTNMVALIICIPVLFNHWMKSHKMTPSY